MGAKNAREKEEISCNLIVIIPISKSK